MTQASTFQTAAMEKLAPILRSLAISATFEPIDSPALYFVSAFQYGGRRFCLEIYDDQIGLDINGGRVDSEIFRFPDSDAKLNDFARRFERVLVTGEWFGPEDPTMTEAASQSLRGCFRWVENWWRSRIKVE